MEFKTWLLYLITEFVLCITPGPAVLLVSSQAIKYGFKPSYYGALGISSGNLLYFLLSALGLGALILSVGNLFLYIKIAGALYLLLTGGLMICSPFRKVKEKNEKPPVSGGQANFKSFLQGFITQAANPKAIIFFVALLPQFVEPEGSIALQLSILAITTVIIETAILTFYGWMGAKSRKLVGKNKLKGKWQDPIAGLVLIGLGLNILLSHLGR